MTLDLLTLLARLACAAFLLSVLCWALYSITRSLGWIGFGIVNKRRDS